MPALANPRHEAFAQAIMAGLLNGDRETYSNGTAYRRAGYIASNRNSADAAASRLLRIVKPISERVRELQAEHARKLAKKIDLSRERIGRNLDEASEMAKRLEMPAAIVQAEAQIAKIFHGISDNDATQQDYNSAKSMTDIGRMLLQSIGFASPDDVSIQAAIEANDAFIERLEAIRDTAQGLTLEHKD